MAEKETPVVTPVATSSSPAETTKSETQVEGQEVETSEQAAPDAPQEGDQAELKTRLTNAITEGEKKNEELRKAVDIQAEIVRTQPEFIEKIAATDLEMANKVVAKVWGEHGIRSYKQLVERVQKEAELEEVKQKNPELYETKKELSDVKERLERSEQKERNQARKKFLESKGILENEYDPNFKKFQDSLQFINPTILQEDYGKALELAHNLAFGSSQVVTRAPLPTIDAGQGTPPAPIPAAPQITTGNPWLSSQLQTLRSKK